MEADYPLNFSLDTTVDKVKLSRRVK